MSDEEQLKRVKTGSKGRSGLFRNKKRQSDDVQEFRRSNIPKEVKTERSLSVSGDPGQACQWEWEIVGQQSWFSVVLWEVVFTCNMSYTCNIILQPASTHGPVCVRIGLLST